MGTLPIVKRLFNSGEFSPKVYGRTDIERYEGGSKTLQDFLPIPQGGIVRRPGTSYIATAVNNTVRLVPFQFSTTQAYILEFGNQTMRVYKDGGQVLDANNDAYAIATPYGLNDIGSLQYAQSFDTLYIVHNNYAPRELTRNNHNSWNMNTVTFNNAPGAWSNNNGWPRAISFYQDRLVFGGSAYRPHRLWFSKTGDYVNFTTGTNDADSFQINTLSGTADVVQWLSSHKALLSGVDSGVWAISAANGSTIAISPVNRKVDKDSYFGSAAIMPARLGDHIIYTQYLATKVRDLSYSVESDGYGSSELSVLADHLIEGHNITDIAYQQTPFEVVWFRRNDGRLLALTYLAEHKVIGWSQHTPGNVISVACIPGNLETELWLATSRNVNNANVTYIERMNPFYFSGMNNAFFVDCGLAGNAGSNTVSGLNHLEGRTVQYLADGLAGNATVSNGAITISASSANNIVVGLRYDSVWESLPVEAEIKSGPTMFTTKRIVEMSVRVRNSAGGSYGPNNNYQTTLLNNSSLFSGDQEGLSVRGGYNSHRTVMIKQTQPFPLAIDSVGLEVEVE